MDGILIKGYKKRLALLKLPSLKSRRKMLMLITGVISSQFLLQTLHLRVPVRPTRYYNFINIKYYTTNYANFDPFRRICNDFNNLYLHIDFNKKFGIH